MTLARLLAGWNAFWFAPQSPLPMAVFRVLFGLILLATAWMMAPEWFVWFGERGVLSAAGAESLNATQPRLTLMPLLPTGDAWLGGFFGLFVAASLGVALGFCTRSSALVVFLCLLSLQSRNPLIFNGGDAFMRVSAFILIFSQAGRALSLDRYFMVAQRHASGPPAPCAPWAQRLLQLQLAAVYLNTAFAKSLGTTWLDGTAVYYALSLEEFARFPVPFLLDHMLAIQLATWGTLALEFALGLFLWVRELRYPLLLGGLALHAGIEWTMNIPLFAAVMVAAYVTFVEPAHLERALVGLRSRASRLRPARWA